MFHGIVTPGLQARLERGTAPNLLPQHRLNKDCQSCKKCPLCFEAAPGYMLQIVTKAFASRVQKVPIQDLRPSIPPQGLHKHATHVFQVSYLKDPTADSLSVNYGPALKRHETLRNNFSKLTRESRDEFSERLSSGLGNGYWHIAMGKELEELCRPDSGAYFLPSGYVLKPVASGSSTPIRLVLDPSMMFNTQLLPPVNIENNISSVLRKVQSLPI